MEEIQSLCGISRKEYLAAVRLCPTHPAFAGSYEEWIGATSREIERVLNYRDGITGDSGHGMQ
jgi:hypothetical protein